MRLLLLGVRGSTPAPGAEFVRYGGHTSCVAVIADGATVPSLVLDAGTGFRGLSATLGGAAYEGAILLSHLHWDHMQGLPFCVAADRDDARVDLFLPDQDGANAHDLLARNMSPPSFPILPEGLKGRWSFNALAPGKVDIEHFAVTAADAAHKGGRTFGFTVRTGEAALGYVPDHAPELGVSDDALDALADVDVLVHDAQFLEQERPRAVDYGHATVDDAIRLAERVRAGRVVLFHHGPHRTDDALDAIGRDFRASMPLCVAAEGLALDLS